MVELITKTRRVGDQALLLVMRPAIDDRWREHSQRPCWKCLQPIQPGERFRADFSGFDAHLVSQEHVTCPAH